MCFSERKDFQGARRSCNSRRARGFTLLEVLVAVVILSFGLLGMVGLQAASLKASREARLQAAGSRLAAELGDLMRNNKTVSTNTTPGASTNPYLVQANFSGGVPDPTTNYVTPASPNCFSTACTSALQTAQADIADWQNRVAFELPGARVVVCFDATPFDSSGLPQWACSGTGGVVNVKIGWTRGSTNRAAAGSAALELATDTNGRPLVVMPITAGNS